jgi:putative transposase
MFRIYPNQEQEKKLAAWLETCRRIYNAALAQRKEIWERDKRSVTRVEQQVWLKEAKKDNPFFQEVHSQVAQEVLFRVDRAFADFFRRIATKKIPGYPRFKGKDRYRSITFTQCGDGLGASFGNGRLNLSKIGLVKIEPHREIPGPIKTVTIRQEASGRWYAIFAVEIGPSRPEPHAGPAIGLSAGPDSGREKLATLSDGSAIETPTYIRRTEKRLERAQRRLSRKQKSSRNREKAGRKAELLQAKIRNQRQDFLHKESRRLVNRYGLIAVADPNAKRTGAKTRPARIISDSGWNEFLEMLCYKAAETGSKVVEVSRAGASKEAPKHPSRPYTSACSPQDNLGPGSGPTLPYRGDRGKSRLWS